MDIVHHALIGGIGFSFCSYHQQEMAGMAFLAGSVFPDLDVFFMALGKRFYLKNHQGLTHSLVLLPLFAGLIAFPLGYYIEFNWFIVLAAILGLLVHTLLDWTNTFGISLFWPLSKKRWSLNAIFFIDLPTLLLTGSCYFLYYQVQASWVFYAYFLAFFLYVLFKFGLHHQVKKKLQCTYAIPSSWNPFEFYIMEKEEKGIRTYRYQVLSQKNKDCKTYEFPIKSYQQMAEKSLVFQDVSHITKFFQITKIEEEAEGITLIAQDLAVRNFGGKFGKTTLKFNSEGSLIHEMANI